MTDGAGGRGGDVTLRTPNGMVVLPENTPGAIHLGNGGGGVDIAIDANTIGEEGLSGKMTNRGGRSGFPFIDASEVVGLPSGQVVLDEELRDSVRDTLIGEVGDTVTVFLVDPETGPYAGGIAGRAGDVEITPGKGQNAKLVNPFLRSQNNGSPFGAAVSGVDGANGWFSGGDGADATATGKKGASPGADGDSAFAFGGRGGRCGNIGSAFKFFTSVGCEPGRGGDAKATGGASADGRNPTGSGGGGGSAIAGGARGGATVQFLLGGGIGEPFVEGPCGNATAVGGRGGNGGQACDPLVSASGGDGGTGGNAEADAPVTFTPCAARVSAKAGDGGGGGDSPTNPGEGGEGATAKTNPLENGVIVLQQNGANGSDGMSVVAAVVTGAGAAPAMTQVTATEETPVTAMVETPAAPSP